MHLLFGVTPPRTPEVRKQEITRLAIAAGTAPSDVKKVLKFVGFKNVVRDAGDTLGSGADQAEAIWSACSALAHGDIHNLMFLDREIVGTQGNVHLAKLTSNTNVLLRATDLSVSMLRHGFALFEKAAAKP